MQFEDIMKLPWREAAELLLRDGPKNCSWADLRDYILETYTQDQILSVNVRFWQALNSLDPYSKDPDILKEYDAVCDVSDYWWYAMEDREAFHKAIEPHLREDEKMS